MPNPSSVVPNSNSRSRRRQLRLQARRNARMHYPYSSTQHWNNQNRRRRELKQQAAFNLDDYYGSNEVQDHYQENGSSTDGHRTANSNRFSVLQDRTPSHNLQDSVVSKDFTFRMPAPWTSEEDATALNSPSHEQYPPPEILCSTIPEQPMPEPIAPTSIPSPPLTPPYLHLQDCFEVSMPQAADTANATYGVVPQITTALTYPDHYTIPSPLLYHRRSPDLSQVLSNDVFATGLAVSYNQDVPVLNLLDGDERFHQPSAINHTPEEGGNGFVAAALPLMGSALYSKGLIRKDSLERMSISQASRISSFEQIGRETLDMSVEHGESCDTERECPQLSSRTHGTTHGSSLQRIATQAGPICLKTSKFGFTTRHCRSDAMYDDDTSLPDTAPSDYLDHQDPIFRLWLDFERSMQHRHSNEGDNLSTATPVLRRAVLKESNAIGQNLHRNNHRSRAAVEVAVCPAPFCLALIPATCGRHSRIRPGLVLENPATSSESAEMEETIDHIAQDLGLDKQHAHRCRLQYSSTHDDTSKSSQIDYDNAEDVDRKLPISFECEQTLPAWFDSRAGISIDEGYYSDEDTLGGMSGIAPEEANTNDWDEYDWVFLDGEDVESSKIGLYATIWDNKD